MKKTKLLILITLIHAGISISLFLACFSYNMKRLDTGQMSSLGEKIIHLISTILLWPIVIPLSKWGGKLARGMFPGPLGYIPFILNSFIWALAIYWGLGKIKNKNI